jgi:hypothetical protein
MNIEKTNEVLMILQEECAEVIQAISKIFRFGEESTWEGKSNMERIEMEVGDVLAMIDLLVENCYLSDSKINAARQSKKERLKTWSTIYEPTRTS